MVFEKQLAAQSRQKQFCRGNQADGMIFVYYMRKLKINLD
jgi:hypothetical protein